VDLPAAVPKTFSDNLDEVSSVRKREINRRCAALKQSQSHASSRDPCADTFLPLRLHGIPMVAEVWPMHGNPALHWRRHCSLDYDVKESTCFGSCTSCRGHEPLG
jgi:hypothetical protein